MPSHLLSGVTWGDWRRRDLLYHVARQFSSYSATEEKNVMGSSEKGPVRGAQEGGLLSSRLGVVSHHMVWLLATREAAGGEKNGQQFTFYHIRGDSLAHCETAQQLCFLLKVAIPQHIGSHAGM